MKIETSNQLCGRARHAIFFAGFGALWLALALNVLKILSVPIALSLVLALAVLLASALYLLHLAKQWPRVPCDPAVGRALAWINALLGISIAALFFALRRLNLDAYFLSALTAIVGVHKLSLARLFRYSPYYAAGAVLIVWSAVSILFVPVEDLPQIAALGTGIFLWFSAAATLAMTLRDARQSKAMLTP